MEFHLENIGKRIRELRESAGMTQIELAKIMNIRREVVAKWETGTQDLKSENTVILANLFNVTADFILRGIDSQNVSTHNLTGLSDKAIDVLKWYNTVGDYELISILNCLLEQEAPPLDVPSISVTSDTMSTEEEEEYFKHHIQEQDKYLNEWYKNHITVLHRIANYLSTNLLNDEKYIITENGDLVLAKDHPWSKPEEKTPWKRLIVIKSVNKNSLIEKTLLLEIQDKLQELKKKYFLTGENNSPSNQQ